MAQHGGRRPNQTGRPRKADKLSPFPLRVPPALRLRYDKADKAMQAEARAAMIAALRTVVGDERRPLRLATG